MDNESLQQEVKGVAALDDPVRRKLYFFVAREHREVSRDEAARAVGTSRGLAAFHLDRLVQEGLLDVAYRRLTGKSGPGAGRPSKLYRRSGRQITVSLPPRSYELAARLFAEALSSTDSETSGESLAAAAQGFGERLGAEARALCAADAGTPGVLAAIGSVLQTYGFEPAPTSDGGMCLYNCPFHTLARAYTTLVCGMNLDLMRGVLRGAGADDVIAEIVPRSDMCCVVLRGPHPNSRA